MRVSPHMPSEVLQQRQEYDARAARRLGDEHRDGRPPRRGTAAGVAGDRVDAGPGKGRGARLIPHERSHRAEGGTARPFFDTIAVYPAGADPDRFRGKRAGYGRPQPGRTADPGQGRPGAPHRPLLIGRRGTLSALRRQALLSRSLRPTFAVVSRPAARRHRRARAARDPLRGPRHPRPLRVGRPRARGARAARPSRVRAAQGPRTPTRSRICGWTGQVATSWFPP